MVNFDLIQAAGAKWSDKEKCSGSWQTLLTMFSRLPGENIPHYSNNTSIKMLIRAALTRVNQAVVDSLSQITTTFAPVEATNTPSQLAGIRAAEIFLCKKIQGYGGTAPSTGAYQSGSDGLGFLLKRIHEMLLGVALVTESWHISNIEEGYKGPNGEMSKKNIKKVKEDLLSHAVFRKGPPDGTLSHDWLMAKREAYAAFAIFASFGTAGWFTVMNNYRKYNQSDIYGIMTLADQRLKTFKVNDPSETPVIDSTHPLVIGAWKYLNGHLLKLIDSCGFTSNHPDWNAMQHKWAVGLDPTTIAELVLLDVYSEVSNPDPCTSRAGGYSVPIRLDPTESDSQFQIATKLKKALPSGLVNHGTAAFPPPPPMNEVPPAPPGDEEGNLVGDDSEDVSMEEVSIALINHMAETAAVEDFIDDEAEESDD